MFFELNLWSALKPLLWIIPVFLVHGFLRSSSGKGLLAFRLYPRGSNRSLNQFPRKIKLKEKRVIAKAGNGDNQNG